MLFFCCIDITFARKAFIEYLVLQTFAMNVVQVSFLLGHAQLGTTMRYLDISKDEKLKAMATLESEKQSSVPKKWRSSGASLKKLCGFE